MVTLNTMVLHIAGVLLSAASAQVAVEAPVPARTVVPHPAAVSGGQGSKSIVANGEIKHTLALVTEALRNGLRTEDLPALTASFSELQLTEQLMEPSERLLCLPALAVLSWRSGDVEKARRYALDILNMAAESRRLWEFGIAYYYANQTLGLIAMRVGDISGAAQYLLESPRYGGKFGPSGPSMTLAKALLERGESRAVIDFLGLCRAGLGDPDGKLDVWAAAIRGGAMPQFEKNASVRRPLGR